MRLWEMTRDLPYRIKLRLGKKPKVRMLYLEVTHRCNARCITCYTRAGQEKEDVLSLDEKKDVVRQARQLRAHAVSLSGSGEPLLYPPLFELIDFIRQHEMQVVIFTNGMTIDRPCAEQLIRNQVVVYFKLFSLVPDVFDRMTGKKNAYTWVPYTYSHNGATKETRIPEGLKHLLDTQEAAGLTDRVRAESLITKINHRTLPDVARFCQEANLMLHLETPVFAGRAIENFTAIALRDEEYKTLYHELVAILGQRYFDELRAHPCPVERNPVVWTNGDVGLCSSRPAKVGNVREMPLEKLFHKAQILKRREDHRAARFDGDSQYFRTCPARRYYHAQHGIHCNY
jgi:MoaA/NifB/PqqE/SkfB family radical SAM enzyme